MLFETVALSLAMLAPSATAPTHPPRASRVIAAMPPAMRRRVFIGFPPIIRGYPIAARRPVESAAWGRTGGRRRSIAGMQHGDHHGPAGRAELLEDRLDVDLDGGVAAAEAAGDLLVAEHGRQLVEHLALAPGEGSPRRRPSRP